MRLLTSFLAFLLALTACTEVAAPESRDPSANATFETSLLAIDWKGESKENLLFPLDPASGKALRGYTPISLGQSYTHAFSPDRRTLAVISFPSEYFVNGSLLLIDLTTWKTQKFDVKLDGGGMVFSPDGERLAISSGYNTSKLAIFDLKKGAITARGEADFAAWHLKFTSSSDALMLYGPVIKNRFTENESSGGPPRVLLLDAEDLSPRWSAELEGIREGIYPKDEKTPPDLSEPGTAMYLSPALAFAPDRDALYIVHADSEQLTTVDFGAQEVETVAIQAKLGWFEWFLSLGVDVAYAKVADGTSKQAAISPNGEFLYVVGVESSSYQDQQGNWQVSQTPLGPEIIQTRDGSRVERFESDATNLSLSPDGRFLYLHNWGTDQNGNMPSTEVFDISSRQTITHKSGIYAIPALRMNGEFLLVSTYSFTNTSHRMSILQPDDLRVLTEWTGPDYLTWLSP